MANTVNGVDAVFAEAIEIASEEQREAYVTEACRGDLVLERQVRGLLDSHFAAGSFMQSPVAGLAETVGQPEAREPTGMVIGRYKLLERIGEGGFGVVFMAEQQEPVRRKVALKLIKAGMDTRQVIARFEAERQALALMEHPNIAKVLDAGATEAGRPYFVMELVHGIPVTTYCDRNRLTARERLELFVPVCQAVQHAHQKGIIHRDLKPGNVLVTLHDGVAVPKVIDFGVAKATGQQLTERTLFTSFQQMVGTPLYMSPEQAEMSGLGVDTRSDVYSLGVLLYELLTGTTPFDRERLRKAAFDEVRRIIREEEPPRPSTRLSTMGDAATAASADRRSDPGRLGRIIRGELDWIVMKALEKDRDRRYETASGLAADVKRYLDDEPVRACPPTAAYRLRKLARRHRGLMAGAAVVIAALLMGVVASTWQMLRAMGAEQRAIEERNAKEQARRDAVGTAERAGEVINYLVQALKSPHPERDGRSVTMVEVLEQAARELPDRFRDMPLVKSALLNAIGTSYRGLGLYREAIPLLEESYRLQVGAAGAEHRNTLAAMNNLAAAYDDGGQVDKALPLYETALKLQMAVLGPDHPDTMRSMDNLALGCQATGQFARAMHLHEEVLKLKIARLGQDDRETLISMRNLALAYEEAGRSDQALPLIERTFELMKSNLGAGHADTLGAMQNLAKSYHAAGRFDQALPIMEQTLELMKRKFGPKQLNTVGAMLNLAGGYHAAGRFDEAVSLFEQTLEAARGALGADHPYTLMAMNNLAAAYQDVRRSDEALALLEETIRLSSVKLGAEHPDTLGSMHNLGLLYQRLGRMEEGVGLLGKTLVSMKVRLGPDHPTTLSTMNSLGNALLRAGQLEKALPLLAEAISLMECKLGARHSLTLGAMNNLAWHLATGQRVELRSADKAVRLARKAIEGAPGQGAYWNTLGVSLYRAGDWAEARAALDKSVELRKGGDPVDWCFLAMCHWRLGEKEKAHEWHERALRGIQAAGAGDETRGFEREAAELIGAPAVRGGGR